MIPRGRLGSCRKLVGVAVALACSRGQELGVRGTAKLAIALLAGSLLASCSPRVVADTAPSVANPQLSRSLATWEQAKLNALDATGVVRVYYSSGDSAVEEYLEMPSTRAERALPNYVPNREREGGVDDLRISGGEAADESMAAVEGMEDVRAFVVEYDSRRSNNVGEPPGHRAYFVYVGRDLNSQRWMIAGAGTGP